MNSRSHGTCVNPPQSELRFNVDYSKADQICCFNRHYAEHSGYFLNPKITFFEQITRQKEATYYDSITGKSLFFAPKGRSLDEFLSESEDHGWPSFRDEEVNWDNVRCLKNGEVISVDGTHLGHNLPDSKGNRYCINLVSIAGNPTAYP